MSSTNTTMIKQPFKIIEIPLNKFIDEAIPHHLLLYEQHKNAIRRCMSMKNTEQLSREVRDQKHTVRQLKDLLYELDTLRARVEDEDLDKFDSLTMSSRKEISKLIKDYAALQKSASQFLDSQNEINENIENENPFLGASQVQVKDNLDKLKLQESEQRLYRVETLNNDIEDLHGMYHDLNKIVHGQKESVNIIENNVEDAKENVNEGLKDIIKAYKLKNAAYPVTGALIGSLVGGPVGFIAGFKVGGLAALGCGIAGFTGGRIFKKYNDKTLHNDEIINPDNNVENTTNDPVDKKDI